MQSAYKKVNKKIKNADQIYNKPVLKLVFGTFRKPEKEFFAWASPLHQGKRTRMGTIPILRCCRGRPGLVISRPVQYFMQ